MDTGKQYKIINAYENVVRDTVREVMATTEMCRCEKCFLDACAMLFNEGYIKFVTTDKGDILANVVDMKPGRKVQLRVDAVEAVNKVKDRPNHG